MEGNFYSWVAVLTDQIMKLGWLIPNIYLNDHLDFIFNSKKPLMLWQADRQTNTDSLGFVNFSALSTQQYAALLLCLPLKHHWN